MKIIDWQVSLRAKLIDGASYSKDFYSDEVTLDELIEWLKKFKENVVIVEADEEWT